MKSFVKLGALLLLLAMSVITGRALVEAADRSAAASVTYIVGATDQALTTVKTRVTGVDVSCDATCTGYLSDGTSVTNTKKFVISMGAAGSRFIPVGDVACGDGGCFRRGLTFTKLYFDHATASSFRATVITEPY